MRAILVGMAMALMLCPADGEVIGGFEEHADPEDEGQRWLSNWIFRNEGEGFSASGKVKEEQPLDKTGGKYVQITSAASRDEGGSSILYRTYADDGNVSPHEVRTISFQFRLDSPLETFTSANGIHFSEHGSPMRPVGRSWWISVVGGDAVGLPVLNRSQNTLVWVFYHGREGTYLDPQGFVSSELALETGKTYTVTITTDPENHRWKATVSDGVETVVTRNPDNPDVPWLNYRSTLEDDYLRDASETLGGCLLFHTTVTPANAITYSLADLSIIAETE